jgi:hypothetical protein
VTHEPPAVSLCGIAGSGKTTYAKALDRDIHVRRPVDEEIWRRWGRYGVDCPPARYPLASPRGAAGRQPLSQHRTPER